MITYKLSDGWVLDGYNNLEIYHDGILNQIAYAPSGSKWAYINTQGGKALTVKVFNPDNDNYWYYYNGDNWRYGNNESEAYVGLWDVDNPVLNTYRANYPIGPITESMVANQEIWII